MIYRPETTTSFPAIAIMKSIFEVIKCKIRPSPINVLANVNGLACNHLITFLRSGISWTSFDATLASTVARACRRLLTCWAGTGRV